MDGHAQKFTKTVLVIGLGAVVLLGIAIVALHGRFYGSKPTIEIRGSSVTDSAETASPSGEVVIDVSGAVQHPGVVRIAKDARVQDAIAAAGGFSEDADNDRIAKGLNLAGKLTDGSKLYVPKRGEITGPAGVLGTSVTGSIPDGKGNRVVNINTASKAELESLPAVGPVTAQKVIDARPYQSIEDLRIRKIVSQSVFDKIAENISVY